MIFPNPLRGDKLIINSPSKHIESVSLLNPAMETIMTVNNLEPETTEVEINKPDNLISGLYFVRVKTAKEYITQKLIIE